MTKARETLMASTAISSELHVFYGHEKTLNIFIKLQKIPGFMYCIVNTLMRVYVYTPLLQELISFK